MLYKIFLISFILIIFSPKIFTLEAAYRVNSINTDLPAKQLMLKMLAACDALKSAKFILKSKEKERNGTIQESEMFVKLQSFPTKKLYLYLIKPQTGVEVLWKRGESSNKVLINPNGFPYFNLKLGMHNSLLRSDSHHIVSEIGFDYLTTMTRHHIDKIGDSFFNYVSISDTLQWDNHTCYELTVDYAPFKYFYYTVKLNETITTIANKFHVNDYALLNQNPQISDYDDVKPGQVIRIPNFYNRKIVMYVHHENFLPLVQTIYDETGLLEKYEMTSFALNPAFHHEEFSSEYYQYGF